MLRAPNEAEELVSLSRPTVPACCWRAVRRLPLRMNWELDRIICHEEAFVLPYSFTLCIIDTTIVTKSSFVDERRWCFNHFLVVGLYKRLIVVAVAFSLLCRQQQWN